MPQIAHTGRFDWDIYNGAMKSVKNPGVLVLHFKLTPDKKKPLLIDTSSLPSYKGQVSSFCKWKEDPSATTLELSWGIYAPTSTENTLPERYMRIAQAISILDGVLVATVIHRPEDGQEVLYRILYHGDVREPTPFVEQLVIKINKYLRNVKLLEFMYEK